MKNFLKKKFLNKSNKNQRLFHSYDEALNSCMNNGYRNPTLTNIVVEKNLIARENITDTIQLDLSTARASIGLIAPLSNNTTNRLNILDFGGGGGFHYAVAKLLLGQGISLKWAVVETPEMTQQAKPLETSECRFFSNLAAAKAFLGNIDLVFTSGALQYCPDPLGTLSQLCELQSSYMYLTRTALSKNSNTYITTQTSALSSNGPGPLPGHFKDDIVEYPVTLVPKAEFEKTLTRHHQIYTRFNEEPNAYSIKDLRFDMYGYNLSR